MGSRDKPIAPRSPWQNGFAEWLIGSILRERIDHLERGTAASVLRSYAGCYNKISTHRCFGQKCTRVPRRSASGKHCVMRYP